MEATRSSKTLVNLYQTTRWYNPEGFILQKLFPVQLLDIAVSDINIYLGMLEVEGTDETATLRKSVQLVTLLTCVQEVPGSNLAHDTDYSGWGFMLFSCPFRKISRWYLEIGHSCFPPDPFWFNVH
jgi:hypothetical protein